MVYVEARKEISWRGAVRRSAGARYVVLSAQKKQVLRRVRGGGTVGADFEWSPT